MPIPNVGNYIPTVEFDISHAEKVISGSYTTNGAPRTSETDPIIRVSVDNKRKDLLKFGRSDQVQTTATTLMTLPTGTFNETYVSDNTITHFASATEGDTSRSITIEGHTVDGSGNFTFVTQTVATGAVDGRTKTALTTPLARVTRAANVGATTLTGPFYVAEDVTFTAGVPQTDSAVHLMIAAGKQQSQKAATCLSSTDYWIVTGFNSFVLTKASAFANVELEVRNKGGVFRQLEAMKADGGLVPFKPFIIIPANSDVRLVGDADQNGRSVGGSIQGYLANIITL